MVARVGVSGRGLEARKWGEERGQWGSSKISLLQTISLVQHVHFSAL